MSDGGHLAPVTYLFGAPEQPEQTAIGDDRRPPEMSSEALCGDELTPEVPAAEVLAAEADRVETADRPHTGRFDRISNVSMHALGRRSMSVREMADLLARREFEPDAVEQELERLQLVGLLDDREMATTLVETLTARKGLGRLALTAELRRRKLDSGAIESAMAESPDEDGRRAGELATARARQLTKLDPETANRRLSAFLMRKGYSASVSALAARHALAEMGGSSRSAGPRFR